MLSQVIWGRQKSGRRDHLISCWMLVHLNICLWVSSFMFLISFPLQFSNHLYQHLFKVLRLLCNFFRFITFGYFRYSRVALFPWLGYRFNLYGGFLVIACLLLSAWGNFLCPFLDLRLEKPCFSWSLNCRNDIKLDFLGVKLFKAILYRRAHQFIFDQSIGCHFVDTCLWLQLFLNWV